MICDTSVLLHSDCNFPITTVPEVMEEVKTKRHKERLEFREIKILEPESRLVEKIESEAKKAGIEKKLSKADKKLLALALQTGETLMTDDYEMQKLAKTLGIKFKPFHMEGIKK